LRRRIALSKKSDKKFPVDKTLQHSRNTTMPTGYTADIKDGISFEQFVMNCAKAFGACISMRDLPSDTPIPDEFEPSPYHAEKIEAAREELVTYENMFEEEAVLKCMLEHRADEDNRRRRLLENLSTLDRYENMLDQVRAWVVPSEEHKGLKEFMIKQLEESIKWDDSTKYLSEPIPMIDVTDWLESKKAKALKDIEYHKEEHAKELKKTAERNLWVRQLRESLK
jgi:Rod binding domain-containing protein